MSIQSTHGGARGALPADVHPVAQAMALLWTYRPRTAIQNLLRLLGATRADGRAYTQEDVKLALRELRERGSLVDMPRRDGFHRLKDELRAPLYRQLLEDPGPDALRSALYQLESFPRRDGSYFWPLYDSAPTIALVRLALFSGTPSEELKRMSAAIGRAMNWGDVLMEAAFAAFDGPSIERVVPEWRWELLFH